MTPSYSFIYNTSINICNYLNDKLYYLDFYNILEIIYWPN